MDIEIPMGIKIPIAIGIGIPIGICTSYRNSYPCENLVKILGNLVRSQEKSYKKNLVRFSKIRIIRSCQIISCKIVARSWKDVGKILSIRCWQDLVGSCEDLVRSYCINFFLAEPTYLKAKLN